MYEQNVYLLDLCILSYQLHAQTLIWPFDPYYEFSKRRARTGAGHQSRRAKLMDELRFRLAGQPLIHGPGSCQGTGNEGWHTNATLEPIFSDYRRIFPWRPSFTRPNGEDEPWIIYDTPSEITRSIGKVQMIRYAPTAGPYHSKPMFEVDSIAQSFPTSSSTTTSSTTNQPDLLYCFEGGTGALYGNKTQQGYAAWSMMGFVLARTVTDVELKQPTANPQNPQPVGYDIYIVFRGSRSGELRPKEAGWFGEGNPDWVTDLQILYEPVAEKEIGDTEACVPGFSASLQTMLPTIMTSLQRIHADKGQKPPRYIYVTGHSLGGALASLFTSAVILGVKYGPHGEGRSMPTELRLWPWQRLSLCTFSSPVVGTKKFQERLDLICPGSRIYVKGDVVTTEALGRFTVGIAWELEDTGKLNPHEPLAVRRSLLRDIGKRSPAHLKGIPMTSVDNEPWKLFDSAELMLATLKHGRQPMELAALIPNCEPFLLLLLDALPYLYKTDDVKSDITRIAAEIQHINKTGYGTFEKLRSLRDTWKTCAALYKQERKVYKLLGLCLFFNAVSTDPNVYVKQDNFTVLKSLIGLKDN